MTAAVGLEEDLYTLPAPTPQTAVVLSRWITPGNTHPNSQYGDPVWSLGPLIDDPGASILNLLWDKNCPQEFRGQLKPLTWTMINGELRATYLQTRGRKARSRRSAPVLRETCVEWMRLARWLHKQGVTDLADCTADRWRAYARNRFTGGCSRGHAEHVLGSLSALWAFDQLSPYPSSIPRPPWDTEGVDDYLPAVDDGATEAENAREPLDPQVIGPLLIWAIRIVEDFSEDIMAAWAENRRLTGLAHDNPTSAAGQSALEAYMLPLIGGGSLLPSAEYRGATVMARTYIAAVTGAGLRQVERFRLRHDLTSLTARRPGPCPLRVPVAGRVGDRPWREHIDFYEAPQLMNLLGTAAMIICLYLTGMRPQEVQNLRAGCCPDPEPAPDGTPGRHLIRSRHFKDVTDEDGHHISAGEEREVPWVAIAPVVCAVRVLERIVPDGELLFSSAHHDFVHQRGKHGALRLKSLNKRLNTFIAWANSEAHSLDLPDQVIPEDPHGRPCLARFRRTLAWHIARRPGGLVALAIQYGHMRTVLNARTSAGYASRSRGGIHSVLDVETALAAADTAARLRDSVAAGEKISGPAARRAISGAAQTPRFTGRIVTVNFAKMASEFLARDGIVLYDNPDALLICAFKRDNALCDPDPDATAPNQFACRPGCGNSVRTDTHARLLRERADVIDRKAALTPEKMARRLQANAVKLRAMADAHDATAQTAEALR